jgi:predicted  nucleic acid-binding Zn-ribbon protein
MNLAFKLFRLQQIDLQIDQAVARIDEINAILERDTALRKAMARFDEATIAQDKARRAVREAEENTRAQRRKIERSESTLYSGKVTNPKELEDLQAELASLRRYLAVLEDRQLEAMLELDEADLQHQAADEQLQKVKRNRAQIHGELVEERESLEQELLRLEREREAAISSIPSDELSAYEQLRSRRKGIAVAKVSDRTCSACGSTLSAALLGKARSPNTVSQCDFCGRILYAS